MLLFIFCPRRIEAIPVWGCSDSKWLLLCLLPTKSSSLLNTAGCSWAGCGLRFCFCFHSLLPYFVIALRQNIPVGSNGTGKICFIPQVVVSEAKLFFKYLGKWELFVKRKASKSDRILACVNKGRCLTLWEDKFLMETCSAEKCV